MLCQYVFSKLFFIPYSARKGNKGAGMCPAKSHNKKLCFTRPYKKVAVTISVSPLKFSLE